MQGYERPNALKACHPAGRVHFKKEYCMRTNTLAAIIGAIAILMILAVPVTGAGCGPTAEQKMYAEQAEMQLIEGKDFRITVIDGCQYIVVPMEYSKFTLTHKGNCRNCGRRVLP